MNCDPTHIKFPIHLATLPLSGTQILLVWDKPLGDGYDFKVEVKNGAVLMEVTFGPLGFGNAKTVVINRLQPQTTYTFYVYHQCSSNPGHYTNAKHIAGKTLAEGNMLSIIKFYTSLLDIQSSSDQH